MTITDLIEDARYGELAQSSLAKKLLSTDSTQVEAAERVFVSYLNQGLIELFKRFDLRLEEVQIPTFANQTLYPIADPLLNSIAAVFSETGDEYPLNIDDDINSVSTPSYNVIQVPNPSDGSVIFVIYHSAPDRLVWSADMSAVLVPVPPVLLEAILYYIGFKAHASVDAKLDAESNSFYQRFEVSCKNIIKLGSLTRDSLQAGTKLEDNGFV